MPNGNIISELSASPPSRAAYVNAVGSAPISEISFHGRHANPPTVENIISPLSATFRSSSVATTSRGVSPVTTDSRSRRGSYNNLQRQSPAPRNNNAYTSQEEAAQQLQQAKERLHRSGRDRLSLQTKMHPVSTPQVAQTSRPPNTLDPNKPSLAEGVVEVISMIPAIATPAQSYRGSRSSVITHSSHRRASSEGRQPRKSSASSIPATYKPTGAEGRFCQPEKKIDEQPYFGQVVNSFDLVANNIEKAVDAMR